jgi:phage FluMu protein Com
MREQPISSTDGTAKCPYCKEINYWPDGTNCKHYSGHEVNMQTDEQTFFFIKDCEAKVKGGKE